MLFSVEQAFVGRDEIRAPLKTPAWEANKVLSHNTFARLLMAVDKTRNTEHAGTFRNIPEHPGT